MINSQHCIRVLKTIKTTTKIYMIEEYANGNDLNVLLKVRGKLNQEECRLIMRQVVAGIDDIQALGVLHCDLKPENILLHFPTNPEINALNRKEKLAFLANVDLTKMNF